MIFTSPAWLSMMLFGLRSAWKTPRRCMCTRPGGDLVEDLHQLGIDRPRDRVQRLAVDVLDQQVDLADAEQPVALRLQGVDLDQVGVVEHLGDAELVLGLVEELLVVLAVDGHDLEGVLLARRSLRRMCRMVLCAPVPRVPRTWNLPIAIAP